MPGPIPMRSEDLARPEYDADRKGNVTLKKGTSVPSKPIKANPDWEAIARNIYTSAAQSGIAQFYEASDWALLYVLCDELSDIRKKRLAGGNTPAMLFQTVMSGLTTMGLTEGDRRRMRIELETENVQSEDATLTVVADYRAKLDEARKSRTA